jgi:hypothetical protein
LLLLSSQWTGHELKIGLQRLAANADIVKSPTQEIVLGSHFERMKKDKTIGFRIGHFV